jgi:hypothetical protein
MTQSSCCLCGQAGGGASQDRCCEEDFSVRCQKRTSDGSIDQVPHMCEEGEKKKRVREDAAGVRA